MRTRILSFGVALLAGVIVLGACGESGPRLPAPLAPTNLTATATSDTVTLTWSDNSDNETSFEIERCAGAGCTSFAKIATVGVNATSYQDRGLIVGISYTYRICAHNAGGDSEYSNTVTATLSVSPPAAPTNLTATATSAAEITLTWSDNSDNETSFEIERCIGAGCSNFTTIATVAANETTYEDQGLTAGASYTYRICAHNAGGDSDYSNVATATPGAPAAPTNLIATPGSASKITLTWQDNSSNEDNFVLERCTGVDCAAFAPIATLRANTTGHQDQGLAAGTTYSYRVRASNAGGYSDYSNVATATTGAPGLPAAPTNLRATVTSPSEIALAWLDNSDNEDGFEVERCWTVYGRRYCNPIHVPANATGYLDHSGPAAGWYISYRVRAFNAWGNSGYSNSVQVRAGVTAPATPTALIATAISTTQMVLTWQDNSRNEDDFILERCTGATCATFAPIATLRANTTTYLDQGLTAAATYRYRVRAHNAGGYSEYSNVAAASTDLRRPAGPTGLVATATAASQIALSWQDNSQDEEGFALERCDGADFVAWFPISVTCTGFTQIATVAANTTDYQDQGLAAGTTYSYRVRASNAGEYSIYSDTATATAGATPPAAPSNLVASAAIDYIRLTWQDNSSDEVGYAIERCAGAGCTSFVQTASHGADLTNYTDSDVSRAMSYSYRVRAYNAGGSSSPSNTATATP